MNRKTDLQTFVFMMNENFMKFRPVNDYEIRF